MLYALAFAASGSFLLLLVSIFPGVFDDLSLLALIPCCLWLPALGIGAVLVLVRRFRGPGKTTEPGAEPPEDFAGIPEEYASHRRRIVVVTAILVLNLLLLAGRVPRRLAFALSRPAFESQLAKAPTAGDQGVTPDRRLGIYRVDRLAADPRGGVYFRTHSGPDRFGPDTMSYGFAFRPNPVGSPFGRAGYAYSHLLGGWYSFEASNDYY